MSMIPSRNNTCPNTAARTPSFHELKKQASFFLREKIKSARLALTDVTPAELLAEEAVSCDSPGSPDSPTLNSISRAAFEIGDFWRIVEVLHTRLARFDRRNWRASYNSLIVLEHLLTHGPESVADEFHIDTDVIALCGTFHYIDDKGFDWGLAVRKKTERVLKLLEKGPLLREERDRSRKLMRGIQGFGSFGCRASVTKASPSPLGYGSCDSQFNPESKEDAAFTSKEDTDSSPQVTDTWSFFRVESKPLLGGKLDDCRNGLDWEDDHPFNDHQISRSMLAGGN
ncbi:hypothetical protein MLD38_011592 [Melastoma candidum]|uniref:Uncharacterized protein n=1 Tax=Melastoma candidum TaxID=119954 RepID=A0ACB9R3J2_9MYRT|nr:hypothetical protein MLD38_011592 [Melastoma candidum]